jgi:tetratricopeptide (TPR) repeat protein
MIGHMARNPPLINFVVTAAIALGGFSLPARADADRVRELLDQLAAAEHARAAELILREIEAEWSRSGSPTVDLLLQRGIDALEAGDQAAAVEHLTAAIDTAPDFAEAHFQRATAYYMQGEIGPAIDDLRVTLDLNPDHFIAELIFATILYELGQKAEALEIYQRVEAINPQDTNLSQRVDELQRELEGRVL